ncbi:MAG: hypothetical protein HYS57_01670 [Parcubacteria group bacterium]|nr:hypothetical protein [Parcubacteria group bacterium]
MRLIESILNLIIVHATIGAGFCFFLAIVCYTRKWRRPALFFRFGGESPASPSFKRVVLWWALFYVGEVFTSVLFGHKFYVEVANSPFEAVFATLGALIVDRIFMAIEPESHWRPRLKEAKRKAVGSTIPARLKVSVTSVEPVVDPVPVTDESWLARNVREAGSRVGTARPSSFFGRIRIAMRNSRERARHSVETATDGVRREVATHRAAGEARRDAARQADNDARQKRSDRLDDILRGR